MDSITSLRGLKTAVKMLVNVVERLEACESDWKVGCKCSSVDKACFVKSLLEAVLNQVQLGVDIVVKDETIVEVKKEPSPSEQSAEELRAQEESCSVKLHSADSPKPSEVETNSSTIDDRLKRALDRLSQEGKNAIEREGIFA